MGGEGSGPGADHGFGLKTQKDRSRWSRFHKQAIRNSMFCRTATFGSGQVRRYYNRYRRKIEYFRRPTKMLPIDGVVKETATEITRGANTVLEGARAICEWIVDNTFRNPKTRGCGRGDIRGLADNPAILATLKICRPPVFRTLPASAVSGLPVSAGFCST